jgi:hypothetical protein
MKPLEYSPALFPSSAGSTHGGLVSGHGFTLREPEQGACCPGDLTENAIPGWDNPWIDLGGEA